MYMCCSNEKSLGVKSITSNVDVNTGDAATVHIERHLVHNNTDSAHIDAFCSNWDTFSPSWDVFCVHIGTDPSHALG